MKRNLKGLMLLFVFSVCSIILSKISPDAKIEPRVPVQISMITSVDGSSQIYGEQIITVTVIWKSVGAAVGDQVIVEATGDAKIMIYRATDVEFEANGILSSISDIEALPGQTHFTTGTPASAPYDNKVTFKIITPIYRDTVKLSVKIGPEAMTPNPLTNYVEKYLDIKPIIAVETSEIFIGPNMPFEIYGTVDYQDAYMVAMEMYNYGTRKSLHALTTTDISSDGFYSLGDFTFKDSDEETTYIIEVTLLDIGFNVIGKQATAVIFSK